MLNTYAIKQASKYYYLQLPQRLNIHQALGQRVKESYIDARHISNQYYQFYEYGTATPLNHKKHLHLRLLNQLPMPVNHSRLQTQYC